MQRVQKKNGTFLFSMKQLLLMLLSLSVFDAFATDFGLRLELIKEANPMASFVYGSSIFLFYLMKIGFPISLFALEPAVDRSRIVRWLLQFTIGLYAVAVGVHIFWMMLQFS
ncbi:DUF5658 family protein [Sporosarcina jeotgali]|uniref:DUF5658 family protein n=1 Tax=Sporosarcina jeotgali TaxID=3020056 RepID=A0ABZ0KU52_9BACL|nr:DUF5658 family protein [Sporosarcina sp. B2O-1]WOV83343.1 DUF5658 family protein [Sporosarcina sp. B2O-1]